LDEEYEYQNGGDWDWFGIRAASLLHQLDPDVSNKKMAEIAAKISYQGTFYEWNKRGIEPPQTGKHFRAGAAEWLAMIGRNMHGNNEKLH
jgi:hypothetical protein